MGIMDRLILRDDQWERISGHIIGDERTRGSSGRDNRMFVVVATRFEKTARNYLAVVTLAAIVLWLR
jgi:transposase